MTIRLIAALVVVLAVPCGARAQVAPAAPAPAIAPVAAQPAVAPQPAQAPQLAQAPVAAPAPRSRTKARAERAEAKRERIVERIVERRSKGVNVRIDATVIESKGEQVTGRKVLSLTLVDGGEQGSVRSTQSVPYRAAGAAKYSYRGAPLNMDARAYLREDGHIKVQLALEYQGGGEAPAANGTEGDVAPIDQGIKQSVTVVLESGKPLVVAQSADAVGDRRVSLEVKATVLK